MVWPSATFEQIEMMTPNELLLREEAQQLKRINDHEQSVVNAFDSAVINGSDKNGKPLVTKPTDMYDFDEMRSVITGEMSERQKKSNELKEMSNRAKKAREQALKELEKGGITHGRI